MCIGVSIMLFPPSVLGAGYVMWYKGQQFATERISASRRGAGNPYVDIEVKQCFSSYTCGLLTLGGVYAVQEILIARSEQRRRESGGLGSSSETNIDRATSSKAMASSPSLKGKNQHVPLHMSRNRFRPPQTMNELYQAVGRPLLVRLGAASISFFCAGALQTYVATSFTTGDRR